MAWYETTTISDGSWPVFWERRSQYNLTDVHINYSGRLGRSENEDGILEMVQQNVAGMSGTGSGK